MFNLNLNIVMKKIILKKNSLLAALLALPIACSALLTTSCSDFLDTEQPGVTSQEYFYGTDDEATQALYAIYDEMQNFNLDYFELKNILSDDAQAGGGVRGGNSEGDQLNEFTISTSNSIVENVYEVLYRMIYCANLVLENVDDDTDAKLLCKAEAKALRAFAYFELVTLWGPVPLVTEVLTAGNYNQPNSTVSEIWAQIEADLEDAIPTLPLKSDQALADQARCSKGMAQSLLGKAYLYQEKYDDAADMFETVINSGEYSLYPDFAMVLREEAEFGVESIFELSYIADLSAELEGNRLCGYTGPNVGYFSSGTTGICENGWGFCNALRGLREVFVEEGDEIRWKATVLNQDDLVDYGATFKASDGTYPYGCDGLVRMKYGAYKDEIPNSDESYILVCGTNYRLIRYADVLLMAAEAQNRKASPNDTKAQGYVNQVRARVNLAGISSTGDDLFEDIKKERRMELAFEFVRFQDLVRWGDAATVLADQGKYTGLGTFDDDGNEEYYYNADAGYKSYSNYLPFPESEVSVNPYITQNPGY